MNIIELLFGNDKDRDRADREAREEAAAARKEALRKEGRDAHRRNLEAKKRAERHSGWW